jgi:hypothetical protein
MSAILHRFDQGKQSRKRLLSLPAVAGGTFGVRAKRVVAAAFAS